MSERQRIQDEMTERREQDEWDEFVEWANEQEEKEFDEEADYGCREDNYWYGRE